MADHLGSPEKTINLLLAEDNKADVAMTKGILKNSKHPLSLDLALNGEDALNFLRQGSSLSDQPKTDLILLDLLLPRLNGLQLLAELKQDPLLKEIPVIVVSGSKDPTDLGMVKNLGVVHFVTKPLGPAQFSLLEDSLDGIWSKKFGKNRFDRVVSQLNWITHQGQRILLLNFVPGSEAEAVRALETLARQLACQEDGSILLLADLRGTGYSTRLALEWQKHQDLLNAKCVKGAVLGAHRVVTIAINTFLSIAKATGIELGSKICFFEDLDSSQQWLVRKAEG